jgi:hypothetical protein
MLSPSRAARAVAFATTLAMALPPVTAFAQDKPAPTKAARSEAASRFKKGLDLFRDGDYRAALIEFRRAYELAPNYQVLYNIGQVSFQLQDYAGALTSLERYLHEGGSEIPASRRADVQKDIDKLKSRVANLTVTTNVAGAEVLVDDVSIGKTPLDKSLLVSAGRHKLTATKEGYTPVTRVVEVASGDTAEVPLTLGELGSGTSPPAASSDTSAEPAPAPPPDTTTPAPPESAPVADGGGSSFPWPAWLITAGLGGAAIGCGVVALGASSELGDLKSHASPSRDELDRLSSKSRNLALVSDILLGATVLAGGVSLYLTVRGGSPKTEAAPTARETKPELRVGVTPGGMSFAGTF